MKKIALIEPHKGLVYGYLAPVLTIVLFLVLIGISVFSIDYSSKEDRGELLVSDIQLLSGIFQRINADCEILGFEHQKNAIDFLTVKKCGFVGSEIGSMTIAYPNEWKGPYIPRNLVSEGIQYQIVSTLKGYFITPGDGVVLPNGKQLGKDIILDEEADIEQLMQDDLSFKGMPLAAAIVLESIRPQAEPVISEELAQAQQAWSKEHSEHISALDSELD